MVSGIGSSGSNGMDVTAMWQEMLKKADKDGDGKLSKSEFTAARPQGAPGANADDLFKKIDTNNDGFIDEAENAAAAQKMSKRHGHGGADPMKVFNDADKDGDGKISKSDFKAALPQGTDRATANKAFDSMDTNQDGVVDATEYMAAMRKTSLVSQLFPQEGFSSLA
jgi:Ca2+-binding EF-hand superfamily protein